MKFIYTYLFITSIVVFFLTGCTNQSIPQRSGDRPKTSEAPMHTNIAHQQLTQTSPIDIQEHIRKFLEELDDNTTGASTISVPGARALFHKSHVHALAGDERIHLHPSYDGSFHVGGRKDTLKELVDKGRGEYHPRNPNTIMLYGPRNNTELQIIKHIIQRLYTEGVRSS